MTEVKSYLYIKNYSMLNKIRIITQKLGIYYHVVNLYEQLFIKPKYLKLESKNKKRYLDLEKKSKVLLNVELAKSISNTLFNSGGIPINVNNISIDQLNESMVKNESRKTGIESFDGMALNDAVAIESWKHYSFFDLAKTVTDLTKSVLNKPTISILEMGCGAGSMFEYFKIMGCDNYIGLDGNPLGFEHSPIISKNKDFFRLVNLQEEIDFNKTFDLVYTSEVLEHIREDKTAFFIKTIVNHMNQNSIFIGTIATSIMDVHINIQTRNWWLNMFSIHGLLPVADSEKYEKQLSDNHPYNWRSNSSHVFILKIKQA